MPSCGTEDVSTPGGPRNQAARACFWSAYQAGEPAEFASTLPTTEGDPITMIFRVLGPERVEIFVDTTQDSFGVPGWTRFDCTALAQTFGRELGFGPGEDCAATPIG